MAPFKDGHSNPSKDDIHNVMPETGGAGYNPPCNSPRVYGRQNTMRKAQWIRRQRYFTGDILLFMENT